MRQQKLVLSVYTNERVANIFCQMFILFLLNLVYCTVSA